MKSKRIQNLGILRGVVRHSGELSASGNSAMDSDDIFGEIFKRVIGIRCEYRDNIFGEI